METVSGSFRTVQRGYHAAGRRPAGQVRRVHVIREEGPSGWEGPSKQTLCGMHGWDVTDSPALLRDAPHELPDGLSWCPKCIGLAAERAGMLDKVAQMVGIAPD